MVETIIGVMGPGLQATSKEIETAHALGRAIAQAGWILLTGGRNAGVMEAASRGAKTEGGMTIGILPSEDIAAMSSSVDIPIVTGLGNARNAINVLSSRVIVACGQGPGTASEIALAIKATKPVILMETSPEAAHFWLTLGKPSVQTATTVNAAIDQIRVILSRQHP